MVSVRVIAAFTHEGRAFQTGDTITVPPVTAAVLHRQGYVSLTKPTYATKDDQANETSEPPRRRRTYRRKDLVAE